MKKYYIFLIFLFVVSSYSQVGINTVTPSAQLDIKSSNQVTPANTDGILIPKIDAFPATNPTAAQNSMLVYLTTMSGGKQPGFYYWNNATTSWLGIAGNPSAWGVLGNTGTNVTTNFLGTTDNNDLVVKTNNTEKARVTSDGNLGVGTTTPLHKLDVVGLGGFSVDIRTSGRLWSNNDKGGLWLSDLRDSFVGNMEVDAGKFGFWTSTNFWETFNITKSNGYIGIGTTFPSERFVVENGNGLINYTFIGDMGFGATLSGISHKNQRSTTGYGFLQSQDGNFTVLNKPNTGAGYIGFRVANIDKAVITNSGKLGLNTTTPNAQVDLQSSNQATPANTDGILIPKIDTFPATNPTAVQNSMMVYLTTTSGGKQPGFYYWDNTITSWIGFGKDGAGWTLTGNTGTNPATHFVGTTDDVALNFKVNNQKAGRIDNSTGSNTFIGYQSGNVSTGINNTANGFQTLKVNTTGYNNTANGFQSLQLNTTGGANTANGSQSLQFNTTGNYNTSSGYLSLNSNTIGNQNTANGAGSLQSNTTGTLNTANGFQSLLSNTIGNQNTANGVASLQSNTSGSFNTANGFESLSVNTTGSFNTANGYWSLRLNLNGIENTANGIQSLYLNAAGSRNTANGMRSLYSNTTGVENTGIGFNANVSAGNFQNATAIGANALAGASNVLVLGSINGINTATANVNVGIGTITPADRLEVNDYIRAKGYRSRQGIGAASYGVNIYNYYWAGSQLEAWVDGVFVGYVGLTSDRRLKEKIENTPFTAIDRVKQLRPVNYFYKDVPGTIFKANPVKQEGFIADELQKIIPSAVNGTENGVTKEGTIQPQTVNVLPVLSVLTKAVQEQQEIIEKQTKKIELLEERLKVLESKLNN